MHIGIILHSQTGKTRSVAERLRDELSGVGHTVTIEALQVGPVRPGMKDIRFAVIPAVAEYDAIIFGAPVMGFNLSPAMTSYLEQVEPMKNQRFACLITQFFPLPAMGGRQAVATMRKLAEAKGATYCGSEIINWSKSGREQNIANAVDRLKSVFA